MCWGPETRKWQWGTGSRAELGHLWDPVASGLCAPCLTAPHLPGLCVATPVQIQVFREFHLHLRLPVSIRRFEQLELRPVLYNYLKDNLTVRPWRSLSFQGVGGS